MSLKEIRPDGPDCPDYEKRRILIQKAMGELNQHYLWGARGEIPNSTNMLLLEGKDPTGSAAENYFAAARRVGSNWRHCGGRYHKVDKLQQGDPKNAAHLSALEKYKWQRQCNMNGMIPNKWEKVQGESCKGKRHFDCINFVAWCYRQIGMVTNGWTIKSLQTEEFTRLIWADFFNEPLLPQNVWAGDLLTDGDSHIGIATGTGNQVVHAWSSGNGVVSTDIIGKKGVGWSRVVRLLDYDSQN